MRIRVLSVVAAVSLVISAIVVPIQATSMPPSLPAPTLIAPTTYSYFTINDRPTFSCNPVTGAEAYIFRIFWAGTNVLKEIPSGLFSPPTERFVLLDELGIFYWNVFATDDVPSTSPPSEDWFYSVIPAP